MKRRTYVPAPRWLRGMARAWSQAPARRRWTLHYGGGGSDPPSPAERRRASMQQRCAWAAADDVVSSSVRQFVNSSVRSSVRLFVRSLRRQFVSSSVRSSVRRRRRHGQNRVSAAAGVACLCLSQTGPAVSLHQGCSVVSSSVRQFVGSSVRSSVRQFVSSPRRQFVSSSVRQFVRQFVGAVTGARSYLRLGAYERSKH